MEETLINFNLWWKWKSFRNHESFESFEINQTKSIESIESILACSNYNHDTLMEETLINFNLISLSSNLFEHDPVETDTSSDISDTPETAKGKTIYPKKKYQRRKKDYIGFIIPQLV